MKTRRITILLSALVVVAAACGDDADSTDSAAGAGGGSDTGVVAVALEEVDGIFMEGFEIGLRLETPDGEVIDSALWSDLVTAANEEPAPEAYYDTVAEFDVPAGEVVVLATANVGIGPPPEVPDLEGDMRCRLVVEVPADGQVDVEVSFSGEDDCLSLR